MKNIINDLLTEEQKMFRKAVAQFTKKEIYPYVVEWDRRGGYPIQIIPKLIDAGFMGLTIPVEYGGMGGGTIETVILMEETSKCGCLLMPMTHIGGACGAIVKFASEKIKQKYLPGLASGKYIAAYAQSEPAGGSDVAAIETYAEEEENHYVISGTKHFITNAEISNVFVVIVKFDKNAGAKGIGAVVVEKDFGGVAITRRDEKMGMKMSTTNEVVFEKCKVPKENLIVEPGEGFKALMNSFNYERCGNSAACLGTAEAALQKAIDFAKNRIIKNLPLSGYQGIRWMLADMAADVECARMLIYNAAILGDKGERIVEEAAIAKMVTNEMVQRVTNMAIQIHGGYGYMQDYDVERYFRDSRGLAMGGGTPQALRNGIAREILR